MIDIGIMFKILKLNSVTWVLSILLYTRKSPNKATRYAAAYSAHPKITKNSSMLVFLFQKLFL